jgi:hypothetical protein
MSINQYPQGGDRKIVTPFGEALTASNKSVLNIKPTWGVSTLRDSFTASGVQAGTVEENGLLKISTGLAADGVVVLQTRQRGQYQAGGQGQMGVGVRLSNLPSGTQDVRWGYMDDHNGIGFGADVTGLYTFVRKKASLNKTYQPDWNISPDVMVAATSGNIYHVDFSWYGYGDIIYRILNASGVGSKHELVDVHRFLPEDSASIEDPNLPISIEAYNGGGAESGNIDLFIGGRQFSVITGDSKPQTRFFSQSVINHTITSGVNVWEPLLTITPKDTFGPSNRFNSVRVSITQFEFRTDQDIHARLTYSDAPSYGGGFDAPAGIDSNETAVQVKSTENVLYGAPSGILIREAVAAAAGNNRESTVQQRGRITLEPGIEGTLWVRKHAIQATVVSAILQWEEQW